MNPELHPSPSVESHGAAREREITLATDLCRADGTLAPDAVGWSRVPLHRCALRARWGRAKRWNHWCVHSRDLVLIVTVAQLDYLAIVSLVVREQRSGRIVRHAVPVPFGFGVPLGDAVDDPVRVNLPGMHLAFTDHRDSTRIEIAARTLSGLTIDADVTVALPPGHESLNVVIPWSARSFQFTSKHTARPALGWARVGSRHYAFESGNAAFGALDFGRGVWPYRTKWNWAAGAGTSGGHSFGLNLGGTWTDGTGMTENGVWIDGRVHKIADDLAFEFDPTQPLAPWRIRTRGTNRLDLAYRPLAHLQIRAQLIVAASRLDLTWGEFSGRFVTDAGATVTLDAIPGWAEDHRARW